MKTLPGFVLVFVGLVIVAIFGRPEIATYALSFSVFWLLGTVIFFGVRR